jgi:hypothetical protein
MRLERTLWVGLENDRRKGRKLPARIGRVRFVNNINRLHGRCGCRFAPPGMAETGGNPLQGLCPGIDPRFQRLTFGVPSRAKRLPHYRKYRKYRKFLGCSQDTYGREA